MRGPGAIPWHQVLNKVGEILKRHHMFRRSGTILGNLTPELPLGWEKPFRSVWCPPDYRPDLVKAADDHMHQASDQDTGS